MTIDEVTDLEKRDMLIAASNRVEMYGARRNAFLYLLS